MGISTHIKTLTADDSASLAFVDGASDVVLDSTYDDYMFVFTDIGPDTDSTQFSFQVNATDDAGGGYDTSQIQSTWFTAVHSEADATDFYYDGAYDQANGTAFQVMTLGTGNGGDESCAGTMHLFNPASTVYVKHFYVRIGNYHSASQKQDTFISGYINDTTAIDEIQFKFSSGNFDGVIQLYGIA